MMGPKIVPLAHSCFLALCCHLRLDLFCRCLYLWLTDFCQAVIMPRTESKLLDHFLLRLPLCLFRISVFLLLALSERKSKILKLASYDARLNFCALSSFSHWCSQFLSISNFLQFMGIVSVSLKLILKSTCCWVHSIANQTHVRRSWSCGIFSCDVHRWVNSLVYATYVCACRSIFAEIYQCEIFKVMF